MNPFFNSIKEWVEKVSGCQIYRYSLPHGVEWHRDIKKKFGDQAIKTVFDVGANVGQSACAYVKQFPQAEIHSFEPVAASYRELVAATQSFPQVHPHNLGMGREAGKVTINVNPCSTTSSIVLRRPEDHPETIEVETIAGFVEKHEMGTIDFLKVDTEGFDLEVLAGAIPLLQEQKIHFIQIECEPVTHSEKFVNFTVLAEFLGKLGYQLFGVYEQQPEWDGRNRLMYWNAIFICEKLVAADAKL